LLHYVENAKITTLRDMTERLHKPTRAWWRDVKKLDAQLFERGQRDAVPTPLGALVLARHLDWGDPENDGTRFSSMLMKPRGWKGLLHAGSMLVHFEKVSPEPDEPSELSVRSVDFVPSGILVSNKRHLVTDFSYTFDYPDSGTPTDSQALGMKLAADQARAEQIRSGSSLPTEGTYDFILKTLQEGEKATRHLSR
jgi:hypothetical protein